MEEIPKQSISKEEELTRKDEEVFQSYVEDLDLSPEDFEKDILDVGGGLGSFQRWAKEHGLNDHIVTVDQFSVDNGNQVEDVVIAKAEDMPFDDGTFDLVIAHYFIPGMPGALDIDEAEQKMEKDLSEMLRVAKQDGEVRFGPYTKSEKGLYAFRTKVGERVFEKLRAAGIRIEEIQQGASRELKMGRHEPFVATSFLIKLRKSEVVDS